MSFSSSIRTRGFTLIEVLIAIALLVVIAAMAYTGMNSILRQNQVFEDQSQALQQLQFGVQLMQWDLTQAVGRSIRDGFGGSEPAMRGGDASDVMLAFTRGGNALLPEHPGSELARIRYRWVDDQLVRDQVTSLDAMNPAQVTSVPLFDGVSEVQLQFLGPGEVENTVWPPANVDQGEDSSASLPAAVRLHLRHERWGLLEFVFLVQG